MWMSREVLPPVGFQFAAKVEALHTGKTHWKSIPAKMPKVAL